MIPRLLMIPFILTSVSASATTLECTVTQKLTAEHVYSADELKKEQPKVVVEHSKTDGTKLSRCSFSPSAGKVTCETYAADRVEDTPLINTKSGAPESLRKFYVFRSHFDVQVFPSLAFIENNGRGTIAFGTCRTVVP